MRVLLLAAAAMATYEECHLYRSAVIARERGHRRLLPKPITTKPRKPRNSITFLVVSRARSGTDWLRAMLNDHRRVYAAGPLRAVHAEAAERVRGEPRRGPRGAPWDAVGRGPRANSLVS